MDISYVVLIEKSETGYAAHVPDLPTILVAGDTVDEVKQLAKEAIEIYHQEMELRGEPLPPPVTTAEIVNCSLN